MAFRTSAAYLAALRQQRPVVYCGGERVEDRVSYEGFAPTRHCWGTWIYDCVRTRRSQRTLPRIRSIDGEPCHPFWSIPATKEDLLDNILVARQVSRVSPAAGYATIGRDELAALYVVTLRPRARGQGRELRARAGVRAPVPAGAAHDVGGHHRPEGRPPAPARRAAEQGGLPPRGRAPIRRDRRPGVQDAHLGRRGRRGADRRPDARHAEGGRGLRGLLRHPRRRARAQARRPRGPPCAIRRPRP